MDKIVFLRSYYQYLNVLVLVINVGHGIIIKGVQEYLLNYSPDKIKKFTYKDLEKNRKSFLILKNIDYFYTFLNNI